jgi:hypothetical protein
MSTKKVIKKSFTTRGIVTHSSELHLTINADNKIDGQYTKYHIDAEGNKTILQTGTYKAGKLHGLTTIYCARVPGYKLIERLYIEGNVHTCYTYASHITVTDTIDQFAEELTVNQIYEVRQLDAQGDRPKYITRPLLSAAEFTAEQYNAEVEHMLANVQTKGRRLKGTYDLNVSGHISDFTK